MENTRIRHYMKSAYNYATFHSHDTSTHVGAVIIGDDIQLQGTNRFTSPNQNIPQNLERRRKYPRIVHGERDVIFTAARLGIPLEGTTMICPWATCSECAQAIVLAGINRVYAHKDALIQTPERWKESLEIGQEILRDGGVEFIVWEGKVGDCENLFNGKVWKP